MIKKRDQEDQGYTFLKKHVYDAQRKFRSVIFLEINLFISMDA